MLESYEAIYDEGQLEWLGEQPGTGRHRIIVTVLGREPQAHDRADVRQMLEATRGAWGTAKSLEEVDHEVQRIRDEWDRADRSVR